MDDTRQFQALYFVFFASFSGFAAFRNVYLAELGMTGFQMGIIGSLYIAGGVVSQPVWGAIADYTGSPISVLMAAAALSGLAILLYPIGAAVPAVTFLIIVIGTVLFSATRAPIVPIANSLILRRGFEYGQIRSFGSMAFGIGVFLIGLALATLHVGFVVYVYAAGMAVLVALVVTLPTTEAPAFSGSLGTEALGLIRQPGFALVLGVGFLVGVASSSGSAFFSVYMRAVGLGDSLTGVAWAIKTAAEAVVFLRVATLSLGYDRKLAIGGLLYATAFATFTLTGSAPLIVGANLLLGAGYAFVWYSLVNVVHGYAPESLQSTAQTLLTGLGIGAGGALGQVLAGHLVDLVGVQEMYAFLAATATLVAALGYLVRSEDESIESEDADGSTV